MSRLNHAVEQIHKQHQNRSSWQESDDAEALATMIGHESVELSEAIQASFLTGDVFSVASEIADILFLTLRLCGDLGFDPADLLEMKLWRNAKKYDDFTLNNGYTPEEATAVSKTSWDAMGGDKVFSSVYLDHLAHV